MEEPITEQDYAMVRSTNFFPEHRLIETLDKHTIPQPIGSYFESEIRELTGDYDPSKFDVLDFINRRTVHWTLNGLVGDHAYGSFSNSNYIIIEPFKNHINDEGLLNINEADTFFAQDMKLSPEATILMPLEQYKKLMSDPKTRKAINDFKIAVYTGSDKTATEMSLHDQGYVYGTIGTWGFLTDRRTESQQYCGRLEDGMKEISERLKSEGRELEEEERHSYSKSYAIDQERRQEISKESIERFVEFLASKFDKELPVESIKRVLLDRSGLDSKEYKDAPDVDLKDIVNLIGLDKLAEITKEYNEYMLELHKEERKISKM